MFIQGHAEVWVGCKISFAAPVLQDHVQTEVTTQTSVDSAQIQRSALPVPRSSLLKGVALKWKSASWGGGLSPGERLESVSF